MYRDDRQIESADLTLRMYVEYCQLLQPLYEEAMEITLKMNTYGVRSQQFDKVPQKHKKYSDSLFFSLMDEYELAWKRYSFRAQYVRSVTEFLHDLSDEELLLLYLRYEKRMPFRQMGDELHYSHMQISRMIDKILIRI